MSFRLYVRACGWAAHRAARQPDGNRARVGGAYVGAGGGRPTAGPYLRRAESVKPFVAARHRGTVARRDPLRLMDARVTSYRRRGRGGWPSCQFLPTPLRAWKHRQLMQRSWVARAQKAASEPHEGGRSNASGYTSDPLRRSGRSQGDHHGRRRRGGGTAGGLGHHRQRPPGGAAAGSAAGPGGLAAEAGLRGWADRVCAAEYMHPTGCRMCSCGIAAIWLRPMPSSVERSRGGGWSQIRWSAIITSPM